MYTILFRYSVLRQCIFFVTQTQTCGGQFVKSCPLFFICRSTESGIFFHNQTCGRRFVMSRRLFFCTGFHRRIYRSHSNRKNPQQTSSLSLPRMACEMV